MVPMPTNLGTITVQFGMRILPPSRNIKSDYSEIGEVDIPLKLAPRSVEAGPFTLPLSPEDIALGLEAAAKAIRTANEE